MSEQDQLNLQTIKSVYDAFGRGDVPFILGKLASDVRWEQWDDNHAQKANVPWMVARSGPDGVAGFFRTIGEFTFHDFRVLSLMAGDNQVASEVELDATLSNGVRIREQEMHLFTFDAAGKIARFRHYLDTAKHMAAAATKRANAK